ncbi:hypothetical protein PL321_08715 [Caloramator sp. mosi_1]|nr:hypothetical protein [Caloramator sp. mosi_1]WDC85400.1 hypothetical protein PL321_08715 [Caloramator sp. mosi_1]
MKNQCKNHEEIIKKSHERSNKYGIEINRVYPKRYCQRKKFLF